MALQAEHVRTTAQGVEYRTPTSERRRALAWEKLRSVSADVEPAWSGAEVTVTLAFAGDGGGNDAPLARGRRLEVFGDFAAARMLIGAAQARAPQALVGPLAQLLMALPESNADDAQWYRGRGDSYAFAAVAAVALGKRALGTGRLLRADRAFGRAVSRSPLDGEAWRWLGITRLLARDNKGAQEAFDRLAGLGVRDAEVYYLHALSAYCWRRFETAGEELERVVRARPTDPAARDLYACALVQQFRIPEAMRELRQVGADAREGWRLMARKCEMCAEGYRAYGERTASDRGFRRRERWAWRATRAGAAIGVLWSVAGFLWRRYPWALAVAAVVAVLLLLHERGGWRRRAQDQLADAQGQAPNMPCWYASLIWHGNRPLAARHSSVAEIARRWAEES